MRLLHRATTALTAGALLAGTALAFSGEAHAAGNPNAPGQIKHTEQAVCANLPPAGYARCNAHIRTDADAVGHTPQPGAAPATTANPNVIGNNGGYDPSYLRSAYNTAQASASAGVGQTVAIVDAYNDPNAESDMGSYRSYFGIAACTTANGCFRKVNQSGGNSYPANDTGWGEEISLDLDMVSAMCPNCHILLVESNDNSLSNLGLAVNEAVSLGANVVSNSYGGGEYSTEVQDANTYYNHPGVAVVASTGDSGYGVEFPAAAPNVTAVGGTSLYQTTNSGSRNATESAWSGAGSGCSAYVSQPTWQANTGCSNRAVADVSAVADPNTGVWVYDTAIGGWSVFGGTSAASPIVGSVFALGGQASTSSNQLTASWPWSAPSTNLFDVTSGSNGTCSVSVLCTAGPGWDGPTGLGTPNGTGAFGGVAQTPTAPSVPLNLKATPGNATVSLTWSPPATTGGLAITYSVYRSTGADPVGPGDGASNTLLTPTPISGTSYTDTGLTNGTTYNYVVVAHNSKGDSPATSPASATPTVPAVPVPGQITTLHASTSRTSGVKLTWSVPSSATATYYLYRSTSSSGLSSATPTTVTTSCGTSSGATCTWNDNSGTIHNVVYYYQIAAINSANVSGPLSNTAHATAR